MKLCLEIGCGAWADPRSMSAARCNRCEKARNAARNASAKRQAYADPRYKAIPLAGACECCGSTKDLTRDHTVPLVSGGTNNVLNVRTFCRSCNGSKAGGDACRLQH